MKKAFLCATAAAVVISAGGCYRDFDFNADSKAEHTYIDSNGDWWMAESNTMVFDGQPGDIPVPADYDGNHEWDRAVIRGGNWVTNTPLGTISFPPPAQLPTFDTPNPFDYFILPVPADYDGDGSADLAWYRDSDGMWFFDNGTQIQFGNPPPFIAGEWSTDQDFPVPADYTGDGKADLATFSPTTRQWKVRSSADGTVSTVTFNHNETRPLPVAGDFDGVGHAQRAVVGADGWDIEGHGSLLPFGATNMNYPSVADYDGDGKVDLSYVGNDFSWNTSGTLPSSYPVFNFGEQYTRYSVVAGYNLVMNAPRFNLNGRCDLFVEFCS